MATIVGTSGNDNLTSTAEDDSIHGLGGNDTINFPAGGYGDDTVDGGSGSDSMDFRASGSAGIVADFRNGTIVSAAGTVSFSNIERVVGTHVEDHLIGGAGNENLSAAGGDDQLEGGTGKDWLWGGGGADRFVFHEAGNANADNIGDFGAAADKIVLDATVMTALGAEGNFAAGDGRFWAAAGATSGHDADDRVIYNITTRQLFYDADGSGSGAAQLIATLQSGATLSATNIVAEGGGTPPGGATEGDDTLIGTEGDDTIDGLGGNDRIEGRGGQDLLTGGAGDDTVIGGDGWDRFFMGWGSGTSYGNDVLEGGEGANSFDTVEFGAAATSGIVADLGAGTLSGGDDGTGSATLVGIDAVVGGDFDDFLAGNADHNEFFGNGGNDTIDGKAGVDWLTGGGGADAFLFTVAPGSADGDLIIDFASGVDRLELDAAVHTDPGPSGSFSSGDARFFAGPGAMSGQDAADRVVYDTSSGNVWYDGDGSGSGAAQLLATLQGAPTLAATDIVVFGEPGPGTIAGTEGDDTLVGTEANDTIDGRGGNDFIDGRGGNDALIGGAGNDTLVGGAGNDSMDGGLGDDEYWVGESDPFVSPFNDTIAPDPGGLDTVIVVQNGWTLGPGLDNLILQNLNFEGHAIGNELDNVIDNRASSEFLAHIDGGAGNDTLRGGEQDDLFFFSGDYGNDQVDGGGGTTDQIFVGSDSAVVVDFRTGTVTGGGTGGSGSIAFVNIERAEGGAFADRFIAGDAGVFFFGGGGNDFLTGGAGSDFLRGGDGADEISGGGGNDTLFGDAGPDRFVFDVSPGTTNADEIAGVGGSFASASDTIVLDGDVHVGIGAPGNFAAADARFVAGPGASAGQDASDRVIYNTTTGQLWYDADGNGAGAALLIATLDGAPPLAATDIEVVNGSGGGGGEHIVGTGGSDTLVGTEGDDTIEGLGGADSINGLAGDDSLLGGDGNDWFNMSSDYGNDVVDGGAGSDTIDFRLSGASGIVADYGAGTIVSSMGATSFSNVERVVGTHADDHLIGAAGAQNLSGVGGNDILEGRAGNDWLWSGGGLDTFVFREFGGANADNIGDFASGSDTIALDNAVMTALGADGDFSAGDGRFRATAGATGGADANDRVIYNTSTGQLYYDADGSGAGASQLIATVQGAPGLSATDISVI